MFGRMDEWMDPQVTARVDGLTAEVCNSNIRVRTQIYRGSIVNRLELNFNENFLPNPMMLSNSLSFTFAIMI